MSNKKVSFEESMLSLKKVIEKLESGSTSLDEMVKLYEEGIKLTHLCKSKLAAAEERITTLVNEKDKLKEVPGIWLLD